MKSYRLPKGAKAAFQSAGIELIKVRDVSQAKRIGLHLLNPTEAELWDALNRAERDLFPAVLIHDFGTWGYQHGYSFRRRPDFLYRVGSFDVYQGGGMVNSLREAPLRLIQGGAA